MDTSPATPSKIPKKFVQARPTPISVKFAGVYLNLRELSRHLDCDHGHLSRVFNSKRSPSIQMAVQIAAALNMGVDHFLAALTAREHRTSIR